MNCWHDLLASRRRGDMLQRYCTDCGEVFAEVPHPLPNPNQENPMTMTTVPTPIQELPSKGRWTVPAPTYVVRDANGVTALVSAWSTVEALRKGRIILTEFLSKRNKDQAQAPAGNLHVYQEVA